MIPCGVLRRPLRRLATETEKVGKKRNRFMDNQQFEKFLSQKDFFNLEEKVDWRDVSFNIKKCLTKALNSYI